MWPSTALNIFQYSVPVLPHYPSVKLLADSSALLGAPFSPFKMNSAAEHSELSSLWLLPTTVLSRKITSVICSRAVNKTKWRTRRKRKSLLGTVWIAADLSHEKAKVHMAASLLSARAIKSTLHEVEKGPDSTVFSFSRMWFKINCNLYHAFLSTTTHTYSALKQASDQSMTWKPLNE